MEIALIIIIAYILNVFLNRWLNYIDYKKYNGNIAPAIWFFSIMATIAFLACIVIKYFDRPNWFTGKYWDKK